MLNGVERVMSSLIGVRTGRWSPDIELRDEVFPVQPRLEGTWHRVPEGPGLGVEVNEEAVSEQTFKFWEAPHLHRRDGSHTNW